MIVLNQVVIPGAVGRAKSDPINAIIPSERRVGILCNDADSRSALVHLLAGIAMPSAGQIVRTSRLSFPIGYAGGFDRTLSVRLNVERAASIYDTDAPAVFRFVRSFAALDREFDTPVANLPKALLLQLGSVLAYAIPFDTYLFNGSLGYPASYLERYAVLFLERMLESGAIFVTGDAKVAGHLCEVGGIFDRGSLVFYETMQQAVMQFAHLRTAAKIEEPTQIALRGTIRPNF